MPKGCSFKRAFELDAALKREQGVTVPEIAKRFGVSPASARRMIDVISLYRPVYEAGYQKANGGGPNRIVYKILK